MNFSEELTQLVAIIVVLLIAYWGINTWIKQGGSLSIPDVGKGADGEAGEGGKGGEAPSAGLEDMADDGGMETPRSSGDSAADRHGGRFNLVGREAEVAAKVLKRMLRQDD